MRNRVRKAFGASGGAGHGDTHGGDHGDVIRSELPWIRNREGWRSCAGQGAGARVVHVVHVQWSGRVPQCGGGGGRGFRAEG